MQTLNSFFSSPKEWRISVVFTQKSQTALHLNRDQGKTSRSTGRCGENVTCIRDETKSLHVTTPSGRWCIVCGNTAQALKITAYMPHWTSCWRHTDVASEHRCCFFRKITYHPSLNICMFDPLCAQPLIHNHNITNWSVAQCCGVLQTILIINPAVNPNLKIHFAFKNSRSVEERYKKFQRNSPISKAKTYFTLVSSLSALKFNIKSSLDPHM